MRYTQRYGKRKSEPAPAQGGPWLPLRLTRQPAWPRRPRGRDRRSARPLRLRLGASPTRRSTPSARWLGQALAGAHRESALPEIGSRAPARRGPARAAPPGPAGGPGRRASWRQPRGRCAEPRGREVAGLVADGRTNREIATRLSLSEKTIETVLARVFRKLGVRSRAKGGTRGVGGDQA
ncbi:MAG: LuxR C-terminal-related transcriptional regulator [Solirubrobacteraceae bacterium]